MQESLLLTDASVNTQSKIGYGAYLAIVDPTACFDQLQAQIRVKRFSQTSSSKLELQTLLWALNEIPAAAGKLTIYTDSQNIIGLPTRRQRLEKNDYHSSKNRRLNNYQLYQEFYRLTDQLNFEMIKVPGHLVAEKKDKIDQLFTLVDRAARKALREENKHGSPTTTDRFY